MRAVSDFESFPAETKELRQWLLWRWEKVGGEKPTKIPYRVDGRRASSTNPATWTNFEDAVTSLKRGRFDGIGFVVTKDDPYCGLDLDDCINLDTGEITPGATELVRRFDSYTEITPSGEGLRIWIRAEKNSGRCSKPGLEIYNRGRYFTVSGSILPDSRKTIEDRQGELDSLIAEEFPKPKHPERGEAGYGARRPYATTPGNPVRGDKLDLREFLSASGVAVLGEIPDTTAERVFRIVCPWVREHTGGDRSGTRCGQYADGASWFHCEHAHCAGRAWPEFRREVDPRIPVKLKRSTARRIWRRTA